MRRLRTPYCASPSVIKLTASRRDCRILAKLNRQTTSATDHQEGPGAATRPGYDAFRVGPGTIFSQAAATIEAVMDEDARQWRDGED